MYLNCTDVNISMRTNTLIEQINKTTKSCATAKRNLFLTTKIYRTHAWVGECKDYSRLHGMHMSSVWMAYKQAPSSACRKWVMGICLFSRSPPSRLRKCPCTFKERRILNKAAWHTPAAKPSCLLRLSPSTRTQKVERAGWRRRREGEMRVCVEEKTRGKMRGIKKWRVRKKTEAEEEGVGSGGWREEEGVGWWWGWRMEEDKK